MAFCGSTASVLRSHSNVARDRRSSCAQSHGRISRRSRQRATLGAIRMCGTGAEEVPKTRPLIGECGKVAPGVGLGVVGVFSILNAAGEVRYVGISRDVATSLRRSLARVPEEAHHYRMAAFSRPSRTALETTRKAWAAQAAAAGTLDESDRWERPVDVADAREMRVSEETRARIEEAAEERDRTKALKVGCREVQRCIESALHERGLTEKLRFAGLLKGRGLLDVDSVKAAVPDKI